MLNDLPLLVINEEGVREEGIIKGGKFCVKTNKFNLSSIDSFFDDKTVEQQIAVWAGKVSEYYLFLNLKKYKHLHIFVDIIDTLFESIYSRY